MGGKSGGGWVFCLLVYYGYGGPWKPASKMAAAGINILTQQQLKNNLQASPSAKALNSGNHCRVQIYQSVVEWPCKRLLEVLST